jgi:hypothetical protein
MGSEGLIDLTRVFQFAGARSVLASLWSVSGSSTADLMKRFYGYPREGRSKDEALRAAQAELIRSKDYSHPLLGGVPTHRRLAIAAPWPYRAFQAWNRASRGRFR